MQLTQAKKMDGRCSWWVDAIDPKATGIIKKSSKLEGGLTSPNPTHHQAFGIGLDYKLLKISYVYCPSKYGFYKNYSQEVYLLKQYFSLNLL
jgi:hypothetical protein